MTREHIFPFWLRQAVGADGGATHYRAAPNLAPPPVGEDLDYEPSWVAGDADGRVRAVCTTCNSLNRTISEAAAEFGIPVAPVYQSFNGPGHDQDPRKAGLIGGDGIHPSTQGTLAIVDALDALGYEPVIPVDANS